jgi:hypothetical protein
VAAKHGLPRGVPPLAMTGVRVWRCDSLDAVLHDRSDDLTRDFTLLLRDRATALTLFYHATGLPTSRVSPHRVIASASEAMREAIQKKQRV